MKEFWKDFKYAVIALSCVALFGLTVTVILLSK